MKDRENNQPQQIHLPPLWCGSICRNAMNEVCVEQCAVKRDCSAFDPRPNLKLDDMHRFPLKESASMTKEEKFTAVTVYLAKVVDHLQGNEDKTDPMVTYQASPVRRELIRTISEMTVSLLDNKNEKVKKENE